MGADRLGGRKTLATGTYRSMYSQRTRDGRIACGLRGAPYHFGSRIRPGFDRDRRVHARLEAVLGQLLPPAAGAGITYRWGGPLAIPSDWTASVGLYRRTGPAWPGQAATSATASPWPTSPDAPWPT